MGIFEDCPAHADEISTVFLQKGFSLDKSGNPSCQKDRELNRLLHGDRQISEIPRFPVTGAEKSIHATSEMEQIHTALFQQPTGLHTICDSTSTFLIVAAT